VAAYNNTAGGLIRVQKFSEPPDAIARGWC